MRCYLLLFSLLTLTACLDDDDTDRGDIEIQVENLTEHTLEDFKLSPGTFEYESYGSISPGGITRFHFYERGDNCTGFGWSAIVATDTIIDQGGICFLPSPIAPGEYRMIFDSIGYFEGTPYLSGRFVALD